MCVCERERESKKTNKQKQRALNTYLVSTFLKRKTERKEDLINFILHLNGKIAFTTTTAKIITTTVTTVTTAT